MKKNYSIRFNYKEHIIIDALEVLFLGLVFYIAYLIFKEVVYKNTFPLYYDFIVLSALLILMAVQIVITYKREETYSYDFYTDRIVFNGPKAKHLYYSDITYMEIKRPLLDRWFGTFTLIINRKWKMKGIHDPQKVYDYIQKLRIYKGKKEP